MFDSDNLVSIVLDKWWIQKAVVYSTVKRVCVHRYIHMYSCKASD